MNEQSHNQHFSRLIADALAAEQAGVFESTRIDASRLVDSRFDADVRPSRLARFYEKALVGLPLAACLGIVLGIASVSQRLAHDGGSYAMLDTNGSVTQSFDIQVFAQCLAGPGHPVSSDCRTVDLDGDGDVDLNDMSSYQQVARSAR